MLSRPSELILRIFVVPSVLLADEPTGALDSETGEAVLALLRRRVDSGAAGVLVTHESRHAAWADRVVFLRDGTIIWKGTVQSLKRFKDDAREVQAGYECGIGLSDFQDLKAGDLIETFQDVEIART